MSREYGLYAGLLFITIVLTSCSTLNHQKEYEQIEMPEKIEVPVYKTCPALDIFEKQEIPVYNLNQDASYEQITKAYIQSIKILESKVNNYENMINTCLDYNYKEEQ